MFLKTIKTKLNKTLTLLLALIICAGLFPMPAHAAKGNQTGISGGGGAGGRPAKLTVGQINTRVSMAVFLYRGGDGEFVLDNDELQGDKSVNALNVNSRPANAPDAYWDAMKGRTLTNAYYQIFGRTMISRSSPQAKQSLILMGCGLTWHGMGGIQYGVDDTEGLAGLIRHGVWSYGNNGANKADLAKEINTSTSNKTGPYDNFYDTSNNFNAGSPGTGVYTAEITAFLNAYFSNPTAQGQEQPDAFIKRLTASPTQDKMNRAFNVWAYIAAGARATTRSNEGASVSNQKGMSERWSEMFISGDSLDWDNVYIGDMSGGGDGTKGVFVLDSNSLSELKKWKDDPRVMKQVASYLDSLLSLAVLMIKEANISGISADEKAGKLAIAQKYLDCAREVFYLNNTSEPVRDLSNIQVPYSIVIGSNVLNNLNGRNVHRGGWVTDYIDMWVEYINTWPLMKHGGITRDLRHLSTHYNDMEKQQRYSLESSPAWVEWSKSGTLVSMDRIAQRLSMTKFGTANEDLIKHRSADIAVGGIWQSGTVGLGPASSITGRTTVNDSSNNLKILRGLKLNVNSARDEGWFTGFDGVQVTGVGGQFIIGMFAHATTNNIDKFTHSIVATPDNEVVEPSPSDTLNRAPRIEYRFGTTWATHDGVQVAASNQGDAQRYYELFDTKLKDNGGNIEARTYMTRQITEYRLASLHVTGDPEPGVSGGKKNIALSSVSMDEVSLSGIMTSMGYEVTPKASFATRDAGFAVVENTVFRNHLLSSNSVLIQHDDELFLHTLWPALLPSETVEHSDGITTTVYHRGADYILKIMYRADTEIRLNYGSGKYEALDYGSNTSDESVVRAMAATGQPADKLPVFLTQSAPNVFTPVEDPASYLYNKQPRSDTVLNLKEKLEYAVYSSSPEAYAELKNWGVASRNEPGDGTNRGDNIALGDGRSPVDTGAGVSEAFRSDGGQLITEDYEAMAGVPTTEKLYLAVGGSEFIVDIAVQYVPNETAIRSYHSRFNGVLCQHFWNGDAGTASGQSDTPNPAHFGTPPAGTGVSWTAHGHGGFTGTMTQTGFISNTASPVTVTALHSATASHTAVPTNWEAYNTAIDEADRWIRAVQDYLNSIPGFTASSDGVSRAFSDTLKEAITPASISSDHITGAPGDSASTTWGWGRSFVMENDGTETERLTVTISATASAQNPSGHTCTASVSCSASETTPCGQEMATATCTSACDPGYTWNVNITITVRPHVICGACCGHTLPEINDIWQQSFNYDYLKIIGLSVLRLDQGSAADLSSSQNGLTALIGVPKLGVTRQTFYSAPSYNIAQANIFNYMGLQTDGTKNVNDATNEYLRSIAYGRTVATTATSNGNGTSHGQTYSSEAGRVRYWITNADGSQVTPKGTEYQRAENQGNTQRQTAFPNEISSWNNANGLFDAHDYVLYNFGNRSNICDGTSRGYTYNIKKGSWVEKKDGVWRGKAAHDVPWGRGFIYDGIRADGTIDMAGYSASRQYRNSGSQARYGGIIQEGAKGWDGIGVPVPASTPTGSNTVKAYDDLAESYFNDRPWWMNGSLPALRNPIIRDWNWTVAGTLMMNADSFSGGFHRVYRDTRALRGGSGNTWSGGERGDVAPRTWSMYGWHRAWGNAGQIPDTVAQSQPYSTNEGFLRAYTNTANDGGTRNRATPEYQLMQEKRLEQVQATVISDALIFELPNGNQPILYHYKNASAPVRADARHPDTRNTFDELWIRNPFAAGGWSAGNAASKKDSIIIGGFNGVLGGAISTQDLQSRFHWRADKVPTTPVGIFVARDMLIESATGDIGRHFGAKELHNTDINRYMGHNEATRVLSTFILNEVETSPMPQRTMLYNISPIVLSAQNREYNPGNAEVFWETVMLWKDSSNHDYYDRYVQANTPRGVYLAEEQFVRMEELLNNYGNVARDNREHTKANADTILTDFFFDSRGMEAIGAAQARGAQSEQYSRGFGITGYNYNDKSMYTTKTTTPNITVEGKLHAEVYNESADLTGEVKGTPYGTSNLINAPNARQLGLPFILDTVYTEDFNSITAMNTASQRHIGNLRADTPKSGYIQQAAYLQSEGDVGIYKLNSIIIHTPVTARPVQLMPIAEWRDQRIFGQSQVAHIRDSERVGCPGTTALCHFASLACSYGRTLEYLNLDFTLAGTANTGLNTNVVKNTGNNATPQGNITLAGSFTRTVTGLSSNGDRRSGINLSDIGASYQSSMNYRVTVTGVTFTPTTGSQREQMLFGFAGYGITIDTQTGELYIRMTNSGGHLKVNGTLASSSTNTLVVEFGMSNAAHSKVWINGTPATLSPVGASTSTMTIGSGQIGDVFFVGAWDAAGYVPTSSTRIRSLRLEQLAGSTSHTSSCSSEVMRHVGGFNGHVHSVSCLGSSTSSSYLNGTLQDWSAGRINDAELEDRLGSEVYTALKSIIEMSGAPEVFNFTGGAQTYTPQRTGVYLLEVWGAQGGGVTNAQGGLGGYASGEVLLTAGVPLTIQVGGQGSSAGTTGTGGGGYNGGGAGRSALGVAGGYTCNNQPYNTGGNGGQTCAGQACMSWGGHNSSMCPYGHACSGCTPCHDDIGTPHTYHVHDTSCGYIAPIPARTGYGGGGATHIALSGGLINSVARANVLIAAGGGGGAAARAEQQAQVTIPGQFLWQNSYDCSGTGGAGAQAWSSSSTVMPAGLCSNHAFYTGTSSGGTPAIPHIPAINATGGTGGGTNGGNGTGEATPLGATQSAGNAQGIGGSALSPSGGGGGGGWYGGRVAADSSGSGGSGYTNLNYLTRPSTFSYPMQSGVRSGNGMAQITPDRGYLEFRDVVDLPNQLWKTIPDYLGGNENERNPVWFCNFEPNQHVCFTAPDPNACYFEIDFNTCKEPHHNGQHYAGSSVCFQPCMNDNLHDSQFVQDRNVNSAAAEFVSIDWDYTLYAGTIDSTFRSTTDYQLSTLAHSTGRGYYDQNISEFDTVKFTRGKYIKFPWYTLYDGVLYMPNAWIVLGERGDYRQGYVENVKDGTFGNLQGSSSGTNNVWNGQAAAYNVENWSLYNQKIYHDLYKDFYDFYVPLANDELSAALVTYAIVGVNAPEGRIGRDERVSIGLPQVLSEEAVWRQGGRVNNHLRYMHTTPYGASKQFRVDLVGRIGGYVIQDTTDVKFSNTMKDVRTTDPVSSIEYKLDMTNLTSPHTLQSAASQRINRDTTTPFDRVGLTSLGDWVGFEFNADNNRRFTISISGNFLKAGEFEVVVGDAHNGDYIIRISDMTVTQASDNNLTVQFEAKPSESSIVLQARFRLLDPSVAGVYVDKMTVHYGGDGYAHGLSRTVDLDTQNYYVTDMVDVRGIFIERTLNYLGSPSEGHAAFGQDAPNYEPTSPSNPTHWGVLGQYIGQNGHTLLEWYRYASDYAERHNPLNPFNWLRISDATQVRGRELVRIDTNSDGSGALTQEYDVSTRQTPIYGTRAVNTYGTRTWVQQKDSFYFAWKANGGRALHGPLAADYNVIEQYRTPADQISVGSHILFDVTTLGNYWSADSRLEIIPTYYAINLHRSEDGTTETRLTPGGSVTLTPLNIYQMTSAGEYAEVNIFGAPYGGFSNADLDRFNRYRLDVNWENEAVTNFNRRNVTDREHRAARQYSDLFKVPLYGGNVEEFIETGEWDAPIGYTESWRLYPRGIIPIGGAQLVTQDYRTQTYIGTHETYGVAKDGGWFDGWEGSNIYSHQRYIVWEISAQRWHTAIGLPSDSVFVPLGNPCSCGHCSDYELCRDCTARAACTPRSDYTHPLKSNIQTKAIDISKTTVIVYLDIFAYGDVWTLRYGAAGLQRSMWIGDTEYMLPHTGPAGAGQSQPYMGDPTDGGTEHYNPGLPFALFGGSKVTGLADIIKVN